MSEREIVETRGAYRAVLVLDDTPEAPEFDSGDPIIDADSDRALAGLVYGGMVEAYGPDGAYTGMKCHPTVARVLDAYNDCVKPDRYSSYGKWSSNDFERYVRIFHGGSVTWVNGGSRGEEGRYMALALPAYRQAQGCEESLLTRPAETEEWDAYVDGEVYGVVIEKREIHWRAATDGDMRAWHSGEAEGVLYVSVPLEYAEHGLIVGDGVTWTEVESVWGHYGEKYAREAALEQLGCYAPS